MNLGDRFHLNSERLTAALRKFYRVPMFCGECGRASLNDADFVVHGDARRCARFFECGRRKDAVEVEMGWTTTATEIATGVTA